MRATLARSPRSSSVRHYVASADKRRADRNSRNLTTNTYAPSLLSLACRSSRILLFMSDPWDEFMGRIHGRSSGEPEDLDPELEAAKVMRDGVCYLQHAAVY